MSRLVDNYASAFLHLSCGDAEMIMSNLSTLVQGSYVLYNKSAPIRYKNQAVREFIAHGCTNKDVAKFILLILQHNRIYLVPQILKRYKEKLLEANKEKLLQINTVKNLPPQEIDSIKKALSDKFGYKFIETMKIDPAILGGVVLTFGSFVIDASTKGMISVVANKSKKLAQNLSHNNQN